MMRQNEQMEAKLNPNELVRIFQTGLGNIVEEMSGNVLLGKNH